MLPLCVLWSFPSRFAASRSAPWTPCIHPPWQTTAEQARAPLTSSQHEPSQTRAHGKATTLNPIHTDHAEHVNNHHNTQPFRPSLNRPTERQQNSPLLPSSSISNSIVFFTQHTPAQSNHVFLRRSRHIQQPAEEIQVSSDLLLLLLLLVLHPPPRSIFADCQSQAGISWGAERYVPCGGGGE